MQFLRIALTLLAVVPASMAALVYPSVTQDSFGSAYDYVVVNDTVDEIVGFRLVVPLVPAEVRSPDNWLSVLSDRSGMIAVEWFALDVGILPSNSLGGFGVSSSLAPGLVAFETMTAGFTESGSTTGPATEENATPEPGTLSLFLFPLMAGVALKRSVWRNKRRA